MILQEAWLKLRYDYKTLAVRRKRSGGEAVVFIFSWVDSEVTVRVTQQLELPEDLSDDSFTGTAMSSPGN